MSGSSKTPAQRIRLIEHWRRSGMPLAAFARRRGVHPRTLWGWVHDARKPAAPAFVPVEVVDSRDEPADGRAVIEIALPIGALVRVPVGTSPGWVAAIVRGLRGAC